MIHVKLTEPDLGIRPDGNRSSAPSTTFWIGLPGELPERHGALLEQADWFDFSYTDDDMLTTIIAIRKGETGRAVFAKAFAVWGLAPAE